MFSLFPIPSLKYQHEKFVFCCIICAALRSQVVGLGVPALGGLLAPYVFPAGAAHAARSLRMLKFFRLFLELRMVRAVQLLRRWCCRKPAADPEVRRPEGRAAECRISWCPSNALLSTVLSSCAQATSVECPSRYTTFIQYNVKKCMYTLNVAKMYLIHCP